VAAQHLAADLPETALLDFLGGAPGFGPSGVAVESNVWPALVALAASALAAAGGGLLIAESLGRVRETAIVLGGGPRRGRVAAAAVVGVLGLAGIASLAAGDRGHPEIQVIR
jgi:predicted lysophospholipase L1 biosynthesis ABC-type transport system permease subunit